MKNLLLYHELTLLAMNNEKGSVVFSASTALPYGLAAAILLELYFHKQITFNKNKIVLQPSIPLNNKILENARDILEKSKKQPSIKHCIEKFQSELKKLHKDILQELVDMGILLQEKHKFMFIPYQRYPEQNPLPEIDIREKIKAVVLYNSRINERIHALISLVKACELIDTIFDKKDRKIASKNIDKIIADEPVSQVLIEIMSEINIIITTIIVPSS